MRTHRFHRIEVQVEPQQTVLRGDGVTQHGACLISAGRDACTGSHTSDGLQQ